MLKLYDPYFDFLENNVGCKKGVSYTTFGLLMVLCNFADTDNVIKLSVDEISKITHVKKNHLYTYLKKLRTAGIIYKNTDDYYAINKDFIEITEDKETYELTEFPMENILIESGEKAFFEKDYTFSAGKNYIYKYNKITREKTARTLTNYGKEFLDTIRIETQYNTTERHQAMLETWLWYTKEGYNV